MTKKTAYIAVLSAALMIVPIAIDLYLAAFPQIAEGLGTPISEVERTIGIYLAGSAIGQLVLGPLSDRVGRRRVLIFGLLVFAVASAALGMVQSIEAMQVMRFVQALAGAATVTVLPIARDLYGERGSARVISFIMAVMVIAPVLAPLAGAQILALLGWRAIFFAVALFAVIVMLAAALTIPPAVRSLQRPPPVYAHNPYLTVIRDARIILPVAAAGLSFAGLFAFVAGSPSLYMVDYSVTPSAYGLLVGLNAAAMIAGNALNGTVLERFRPHKRLLASALGFGGIGIALLIAASFFPGLWVFVLLSFCFFFFLALVETNAIILALSPRAELNGTVSALSGALQAAAGAAGSFAVSLSQAPGPFGVAVVMAFSGTSVAVIVLSFFYLEHRNSGTSIRET